MISNAYAQAADAAAGAPGLIQFLPLIIVFVGFYFLAIRPQQKRAREHKAMVEALAKGDVVLTQGGVIGRIVELGENYIRIEVDEGSKLTVQRQAVISPLPKDAMKTL